MTEWRWPTQEAIPHPLPLPREYYVERAKLIIAMRRDGHTYAAIGRAAGIGGQRVKQIIIEDMRERRNRWRFHVLRIYNEYARITTEREKWGCDPRVYTHEWRYWLKVLQRQRIK